MSKNYKLVILIVFMLLLLTTVLSVVNYKTTLELAHNQIEKQSLPLSLDNIYNDIQKQIIKPYLITSMMASNTFVKAWLVQDRNDSKEIQNYLSAIKEEYGLLSAILVSNKTKNYYTQDGFLEKLHKNNKDNQWYFRFTSSKDEKEINIDTNEKIDNALMMFINHKIYDEQKKLIGTTSTGVKISKINNMLEMFKQKYHLCVCIYNRDGKIILSQDEKNSNHINKITEFKKHTNDLLSKTSTQFQYNDNSNTYLVNSKYISELDLHILVKAKLSDFTGSVKNTFYLNLLISFIITILVALVIIYITKSSLVKLEASNEQKDVLLKEVHHRVKNNLNLTASMLGLQAMQESKEIELHLLKSKSRIDAIATVHEMLYKQSNFNEINFYDYISKLENLVFRMYNRDKKFSLHVEADKELVLPLDMMIQLGLMINEMFTNTIKYAKNSTHLKLSVSLEKVGSRYILLYKDNGEQKIDIDKLNNSKGLGTKLIELTIKQLDGKFNRYYDNGLCYKVNFKNELLTNIF